MHLISKMAVVGGGISLAATWLNHRLHVIKNTDDGEDNVTVRWPTALRVAIHLAPSERIKNRLRHRLDDPLYGLTWDEQQRLARATNARRHAA